jgi:acyl-coenzyme A thioesterase PaaI-like protein
MTSGGCPVRPAADNPGDEAAVHGGPRSVVVGDLRAAVQDSYPDDFSHCYGCGRLNAHGLQIKTRWDGDETLTCFTPKPDQIAMPGFVYGGLIASLVDCHAMATASAAVERAAGRDIGEAESPRFVTASLKVDFLKPTPTGVPLEIRARAVEIGERKVRIAARVLASGVVTAHGDVLAVRRPATMAAPA